MSELILINNKKIFSPNIFVKRNTNIEKNINTNNVDVEIANSENIERVKRVVEKYNRVMEQQGKEVKMNFDEEINRIKLLIELKDLVDKKMFSNLDLEDYDVEKQEVILKFYLTKN